MTNQERERFEELKQKGWPALNSEERAEYSKLKEPLKDLKEIEKNNKEETVEIPKSKLAEMIAEEVAKATRNIRDEKEGLEKQFLGGWKEYEKPKQGNSTATMKLYRPDTDQDFGIVINWKFLKNEYDEETRAYDKAIYRITCMYDKDVKKDFEIPLLEFAKIKDRETVEIIEMEKKDIVKVHDFVYASKMNREGYMDSGIKSNKKVPLEEHRQEITCKVKRMNGDVININADRLNA